MVFYGALHQSWDASQYGAARARNTVHQEVDEQSMAITAPNWRAARARNLVAITADPDY